MLLLLQTLTSLAQSRFTLKNGDRDQTRLVVAIPDSAEAAPARVEVVVALVLQLVAAARVAIFPRKLVVAPSSSNVVARRAVSHPKGVDKLKLFETSTVAIKLAPTYPNPVHGVSGLCGLQFGVQKVT
jgi:hypothetical protein